MSYPGNPKVDHQHNGDGAIGVINGAIIIGPNGPVTQQVLGGIGQASMGETSGPNAVNPSGNPSGIKLPTQNNFKNRKR